MLKRTILKHGELTITAETAKENKTAALVLAELERQLQELIQRPALRDLLQKLEAEPHEQHQIQVEPTGVMLCNCGWYFKVKVSYDDVTRDAIYTGREVIYEHSPFDAPPEEILASLVCEDCEAEVRIEGCVFVPTEPDIDAECQACGYRFSTYAEWRPDLACPQCGSPDIGSIESNPT